MMTIRLPNGAVYSYMNADGYDIKKDICYLYQNPKGSDKLLSKDELLNLDEVSKVIAIVNMNSGVILEPSCPNNVSISNYIQK